MIEHELKGIACELKAKGCKLRVMTMLREPVEPLGLGFGL
jgi:hypothetical protein